MRGGSYHTVVKSQTNAALRGKVRVNDVCAEFIGNSERRKERTRLSLKIILSAYGYHHISRKEGKLLIIADDGTALLSSHFYHIFKRVLVTAVKQNEWR